MIAPHGGRIEQGASDVARAIAGADLNLYLFEGIRPAGNYAALHLTSHKLDEPRCVELLSNCDHVVAIHGCRGEEQQVLVGGLDGPLKARVAQAIAELGVDTRSQCHRFPAIEPRNIFNREVGHLDELADVYRRGLAEVDDLIDGVETRPS